MVKRPLRKTNTTVLIVVEGETEEAFAAHLKRLYYQRGMPLSVSIKNARGYGPQGIIDKLKSVAQTADFDHRYAVLDSDIPLLPEQEKWLRLQKNWPDLFYPSHRGHLVGHSWQAFTRFDQCVQE